MLKDKMLDKILTLINKILLWLYIIINEKSKTKNKIINKHKDNITNETKEKLKKLHSKYKKSIQNEISNH